MKLFCIQFWLKKSHLRLQVRFFNGLIFYPVFNLTFIYMSGENKALFSPDMFKLWKFITSFYVLFSSRMRIGLLNSASNYYAKGDSSSISLKIIPFYVEA